jgi:hypothetical protein
MYALYCAELEVEESGMERMWQDKVVPYIKELSQNLSEVTIF